MLPAEFVAFCVRSFIEAVDAQGEAAVFEHLQCAGEAVVAPEPEAGHRQGVLLFAHEGERVGAADWGFQGVDGPFAADALPFAHFAFTVHEVVREEKRADFLVGEVAFCNGCGGCREPFKRAPFLTFQGSSKQPGAVAEDFDAARGFDNGKLLRVSWQGCAFQRHD